MPKPPMPPLLSSPLLSSPLLSSSHLSLFLSLSIFSLCTTAANKLKRRVLETTDSPPPPKENAKRSRTMHLFFSFSTHTASKDCFWSVFSVWKCWPMVSSRINSASHPPLTFDVHLALFFSLNAVNDNYMLKPLIWNIWEKCTFVCLGFLFL